MVNANELLISILNRELTEARAQLATAQKEINLLQVSFDVFAREIVHDRREVKRLARDVRLRDELVSALVYANLNPFAPTPRAHTNCQVPDCEPCAVARMLDSPYFGRRR